MSTMLDSLAVAEPLDLVPRRRFDRLAAQDQRALDREIREARENQTRLRADFYARNPWAVTG